MHLTRTQPEANLHRFYRLAVVRGLFGDWGLVRNCLRIGSSGKLRTGWFETEAEAKDAPGTAGRQRALFNSSYATITAR